MTNTTALQKSKGHMGWQEVDGSVFEIYEARKEVYRAPVSNVFDVDTDRRHGRWQCSTLQFRLYGSDVVLGQGFVAA